MPDTRAKLGRLQSSEPDARHGPDSTALQLLRSAGIAPSQATPSPDSARPEQSSALVRPESPPAVGMVARFRKRLFNPLGGGPAAKAAPAPVITRRQIGFRASLAEFLLINRLRARIRTVKPAQSFDVLQRSEHVIFVTCKAWFGDSEVRERYRGSRV